MLISYHSGNSALGAQGKWWEQRGTSLVKKQAGEVVYPRLQMEKLRQRETMFWKTPQMLSSDEGSNRILLTLKHCDAQWDPVLL